MIPPIGLLQGWRLPPSMRVLDLERRFRCRECDQRLKVVLSIRGRTREIRRRRYVGAFLIGRAIQLLGSVCRRRDLMGSCASGFLTMAATTTAAAIVLMLNLLLVLQIAGVPLPGFDAAG
jgi:hypothetical protein